MTLMFVPGDTSRTEFTLSPDPLKADQELGPLREGTYEVGLLAWGYRVSPAGTKVDIAPGGMAEVAVSLSPQGMVGGRIATEPGRDDRYWGFLPAMTEGTRVTSITLSGAGFERRIVPRFESLGEAMRNVMGNRDLFRKDFFIFFDLPKGRYTLRVEAAGYRPCVQEVAVDPLIVHSPLRIGLTPAGMDP
jgi:hypothetical protein